ncbi:tripartite-type tricarboxylate transporter receptor subunit TctC [Stella humosa]|uniref:Tripartite-type tricarboxylate transporter receptor subunit TctC n=1 Tax=Stella humosa TaxID=94 RepID=A0A3N1MC00_9PROT|nr:tripartite tricarboxylate transporter substrate binding protein [Stella humosa]ROQ03362.1 tripartite-type tricarboxylate transporter receptor subunit TctC [Stella humosa]BBK29649.1 ABC transporter substrate-binding protein [Stella humosa]
MRAVALTLLAVVAALPAAAADPFPTKPIRLVVPFPAGGGTDVVARVVANGMAPALGQSVVVENRGGAGGTVGADAVAKAAPDGYTIGIATSSTHPAAVVLRKNVPYDPATGFQPIGLIGTTPYILVSGLQVPAKSLTEFIAYTKANAGRVNYASVGVSTLGYLLSEQLKIITGMDLTHVAYRGASQAYPDVISNNVSAFLDNPTGSAGLVRDGQLRAYAVTAKSSVLPDVPTFAEAGVPGFDTTFWYGFVAPAGTPQPIVDRLAKAMRDFVLSPQGRAELEAKDVTPVGSTPAAFGKTITDDLAQWKALAEKLGIQPE